MKQYFCKGLWLVHFLFCTIYPCMAQDTSISIDNQVPGWLSSKLTYNQQQSLKELQVTGYINGDDAVFINNLINNNSLEKLDLYGSNIVDGGISKTTRKNFLEKNFFSISKHMKRIILPQSLDSIRFTVANLTMLDTLSIGCRRISNDAMVTTTYTRGTDYDNVTIDIMEGVEEIGEHAFFYNSDYGPILEHSPIRKLPKSLRILDFCAFDKGILADSINISELTKLESLGLNECVSYNRYSTHSFYWYKGGINIDIKGTYCFPDNLRVWNSAYRSANYTDGSPKYYDCYDAITADTIIVPATCELLYADLNAAVAYFNVQNPPERINHYCYKINKLYIPKGSLEKYMEHYGISDDGIHEIIEMVDVESVELDENDMSILVNQKKTLTATVLPIEALNKRVKWKSEDPNIASVDDNGNVTGLKSGVTTVNVTTDDGGFSAKCRITVIQPVTGIKLNHDNYTLEKFGQVVELIPEVLPEDASNKNVLWESNNESVCIVANGKVVAVGNGVSVITAKTEDGGFVAVCAIIVDVASGVTMLEQEGRINHTVYDINGRTYTNTHYGVSIIKKDGKLHKVIYNK